jgi:WD40 repeat protein
VVNAASFSADGTKLVTLSADKTAAQIWDAKTGKPIGKALRHEGAVNAASFSADGLLLVTASADDTARIWDENRQAARRTAAP